MKLINFQISEALARSEWQKAIAILLEKNLDIDIDVKYGQDFNGIVVYYSSRKIVWTEGMSYKILEYSTITNPEAFIYVTHEARSI